MPPIGKQVNSTKLKGYSESINICKDLDDSEIEGIGQRSLEEYRIDKQSRSDWEKLAEEGMKLAKQTWEQKDFPWPDAANIKYPLITVAAIQFAARAYPEIIQGPDIVKAKVIGEDPGLNKNNRADRVSTHLSYQILDEMDGWEEDSDRMLHVLPITGVAFKKTYFSSSRGKNVSELCLANDVVVHNKAKSVKLARRISHIMEVTENEIYENVASGVWRDAQIPMMPNNDYAGERKPPQEFIQQHRTLDLDGDGYEEPYIVTFHKESGKVVRIVARYRMKRIAWIRGKVARIVPEQWWTKFTFLPNLEGGFYDMGFGTLMYPLNEAVNTVINELLDSGSIYNAGGGFLAKGANLKGGPLRFSLGEWKTIDAQATDLRQAIYPLPTREPSQVLFTLLGTLIDAGKDISAVKDVMTGQKPGENVSATTVLALIEQGMKVFSAIYKRIYRSQTEEFIKLANLNGIYLQDDEYVEFLDGRVPITKADYDMSDMDVKPVADPNLSLDVQRIAKAEALVAISGRPGLNEIEVTNRYVDAIKIPNPDSVKAPPKPPPPDPQVEIAAMENQIAQQKLVLDAAKLDAEAPVKQAQYMKIISDIELNLINSGLKEEEVEGKLAEIESKIVLNLAKAKAAEAKAVSDLRPDPKPAATKTSK